MKCLHTCEEFAMGATEAIGYGWVTLCECSAEMEARCNEIVQGYYVERRHVWRCEADNDGGIDDREETKRFEDVKFENLVVDGDKIIGVMVEDNYVAPLDNPNGVKTEYTTDEVAGWGSMTTTTTYYLRKGPKPN